MSRLLEWKEKLQLLYAEYSTYIDKGIRFVLALTCFLSISSNIGFMEKLAKPIISIVMAVACAFLPMIVTVIAAAGLMLAHMFALSEGIAIIVAGIIILMFIFYFRFTPKKAIILLLTPIAFAFKVPMLIPIAYGLIGTPIYIVPVICGTIVYFMIKFAKTFSTTITGTNESGMMSAIGTFAKQIFQNKELWSVIIAIVICFLIVYAIRRKSINRAWQIAIVSGIVAYIITMVIASVTVDTQVQYGTLIVGSVVSVVIGFILELMLFSVDYARTEYLQFEDDEYYYYVKALPKVSVSAPEKQVKRINKRQEMDMTENKGATGRLQLTGEADIDKIIEQELMKK
ncbi:hypothetical protein [Faecalimonas sp.]